MDSSTYFPSQSTEPKQSKLTKATSLSGNIIDTNHRDLHVSTPPKIPEKKTIEELLKINPELRNNQIISEIKIKTSEIKYFRELLFDGDNYEEIIHSRLAKVLQFQTFERDQTIEKFQEKPEALYII